MVCGRITEELQIVGRVFVMGRNKESHHPMQECLAGGVVGKQSVPEERTDNQEKGTEKLL